MATNNNNTTIHNTHLEEFIQFLSKADVEYEFKFVRQKYILDGVEIDDFDLFTDINYNSIKSFVDFQAHVKQLYINLYNEILFNIETVFTDKLYAFKYLHYILFQITDLKKNFVTYHPNLKLISKSKEYDKELYNCFESPGKALKPFYNLCSEYIDKTISFINECLVFIKDITFPFLKLPRIDTTINVNLNSFKYTKLLNDSDKINDFYDCLCIHGFIVKEETKLPIFKRVFSDKEITQKVIWHNGVQALRYLMLSLKDKGLIEDPGNSQLSLIVKCFSLADKPDYDFSKFNTLKNPTNSNTLQYLDSAIAHLI